MTISVGDRLPETTLTKVTADGPEQVSSTDYFAGRKVALFAVPGAFTPTCSAKHVPGFVDKAADITAKGVDEIACISVNDAFVMKAWGEAQQVTGKGDDAGDGGGTFTQALGMENDLTKFGLGQRSQRYSMLVNDGVVELLNLEPAGQFGVSGADHLLGQL